MTWTLEPETKNLGDWVLLPEKNEVSRRERYLQEFPEGEEDIERQVEQAQSELARGALSGASIGLTENIPGLNVQEEGPSITGSKFLGSLAPQGALLKLFGGPLINFASKSPYAKKALESLSSIIGSTAAGGTYKAIEDSFKGKFPDIEDVITHGASWGAIDAGLKSLGLTGRFAASLLGVAKKEAKPSFEILNETLNKARSEGIDFSQPERVATKALSILENKASLAKKPLEGRTLPVTKEDFSKISEKIPEIAEPILPKKIDAKQTAKNLEETIFDQRIDQVGTKAKNDLDFGKNIKNDIENQFKEAEQSYEPYYERVENFSKFHKVDAPKAEKIVNNILQKIESLKTKPAQYATVIKTLEDVLSDIGVHRIATSAGRPSFSFKEPVPLTNLLELGRRLNKIIDYDILGPSIKDELKPVVKAVKSEIRSNLKKLNPVAEKIFDKAEKNYASTARKFGKDSIIKIRSLDSPEKIVSSINNPSDLKNLKDVLTPQQFSQVEREILDKIKEMSPENARKYIKHIGDQLSKPVKDLADQIALSKLPSSRMAQSKVIKSSILDDLSNSFTKGTRPENALKLWQNKEGQKLIKDALKDTKNEKRIIEYLQKQSLADFSKSIVDSKGKIDFEKMNELMKDPAISSNIREIGGEEAVTFFKNLENLSEKFNRNLKLLEKSGLRVKDTSGKLVPPEKRETIRGEEMIKRAFRKQFPVRFAIKDFADSLGVPGKTILGLSGLQYIGIPTGIKAYAAIKILYKLASSSRARRAYIHAVNASNKDPEKFIMAFEGLENIFDED